jgi:hypothetical protein
MALPFVLKNIRRQMKNYENSHISQKHSLKKNPLKHQVSMTIAHVAMMAAQEKTQSYIERAQRDDFICY